MGNENDEWKVGADGRSENDGKSTQYKWKNTDSFPKIQNSIGKLKNILDIQFENPLYVKKTRKELLKFVVLCFIITFILALLSIGSMAYFLILAWIILATIYTQFLRVWKYHGYSVILLILSNAAVVGLSFLITWPIRNYIQEWAIEYIRSRGY